MTLSRIYQHFEIFNFYVPTILIYDIFSFYLCVFKNKNTYLLEVQVYTDHSFILFLRLLTGMYVDEIELLHKLIILIQLSLNVKRVSSE